MQKLYEKSLYKLELDQILSQLADCAGSGKCRNCAGGLVWSRVYDSINKALDEMTLGSLLSEFSKEQKEGAENGQKNIPESCGDNRG